MEDEKLSSDLELNQANEHVEYLIIHGDHVINHIWATTATCARKIMAASHPQGYLALRLAKEA